MLKRIVTIQDVSCFGKCSSTVALPLISAMGVETAVIPTAVLSTHTGGFTGYTFSGSDGGHSADRGTLENITAAFRRHLHRLSGVQRTGTDHGRLFRCVPQRRYGHCG